MNLDYFIVRTQPDESELWCSECETDSPHCTDELHHAASAWITRSERAQAEHESNAYDDHFDR